MHMVARGARCPSRVRMWGIELGSGASEALEKRKVFQVKTSSKLQQHHVSAGDPRNTPRAPRAVRAQGLQSSVI
jgi:hypothetical protein